MNKVQKHKEICEKLNSIYAHKNHDYADSFGALYKEVGIISSVTRLYDKMCRFKSLAMKKQNEQMVKDESIVDTLMDMANYAIMSVIEIECQKTRKIKEKYIVAEENNE